MGLRIVAAVERDQIVAKQKAGPEADITQMRWAELPLKDRLLVLKRARPILARMTDTLVDAVPRELARTRADSMAAEVLPLLAACKFLEREATGILTTKQLGRRGLPFWLSGLDSRVERVPLGRILIIGPSNYPLFLPGVQVLQALAAGNAVIWKPGLGGAPVASIFASAMKQAGLPDGLLEVTDESVKAGISAMNAGVDKVFFTGSSISGRAVLRAAAETATPVVAELCGCDAVVVLPSADVQRVVAALSFGMRLNGSATCMAPRRLMLVGKNHQELIARLQESFTAIEGVWIRDSMRENLRSLLNDAAANGAVFSGDVKAGLMKPLLVLQGKPEMRIAQVDLFAPVLTVMEFQNQAEMLAADALNPFGLTAAVFGEEDEARRLGSKLKVGVLLVNDLIIPTADPRVPFGGRRGSGFGVTRGAEGLLEMTAIKTVLVRRHKALEQYAATTKAHEELFGGAIDLSHGSGLRKRMSGLRRMLRAAMKMRG